MLWLMSVLFLSSHTPTEVEQQVQTEVLFEQLLHSREIHWLIGSVKSFWRPGIWVSKAAVFPVQQMCWTNQVEVEGCNSGSEGQSQLCDWLSSAVGFLNQWVFMISLI